MSDAAIVVEGLSKSYRIGAARKRHEQFREALLDMFRKSGGDSSGSDNTIWALDDVSFEVKRGEVLGVIGRNGAGKSTLLKILSRITEPTKGKATIRGRVGSLLEVGTGFHPELTGRENIYLSGSILGMTRGEIGSKFDEIVAFSEIEKFIDTPVKRYSSGMYVRLAFAVAAHLEPEILLVDEVLAVGDASFQKKCIGKMSDIHGEGRTILFVSHNMAAVEGLCDSAVCINAGKISGIGDVREVVRSYLSTIPIDESGDIRSRTDRQGDGRLRFTSVSFVSSGGKLVGLGSVGQDLEIEIRYESKGDRSENTTVAVGVYSPSGQTMMLLDNRLTGDNFGALPKNGAIVCRIEKLPLPPGRYFINLFCEVNGVIADWIQGATALTVESGDFFGTGRLPPATHNAVLVDHRWRLESEK